MILWCQWLHAVSLADAVVLVLRSTTLMDHSWPCQSRSLGCVAAFADGLVVSYSSPCCCPFAWTFLYDWCYAIQVAEKQDDLMWWQLLLVRDCRDTRVPSADPADVPSICALSICVRLVRQAFHCAPDPHCPGEPFFPPTWAVPRCEYLNKGTIM